MDIITVKLLNNFGRWGNCLFQYATARKYAEEHKSQLQTPNWVGEKVFNISDPRITAELPTEEFDHLPWGKTNINLSGYFQFQEIVSHWKRSELKSWFTFQDCWLQRFPKKRPFYVACHLRQGDYLTNFSNVFCNMLPSSYEKQLKKMGVDPKDVIYVKESEPELAPDLKGQGVKGIWGEDLDFLPDFMTLVNADIVLRANSTFSWWAGVLSKGKVYSPLVEDKVGPHEVEFVEGNWPRVVDNKNCHTNVSDLHLSE